MDSDDEVPADFRRKALTLGVVRYDQHQTLWQIAKHCGKTMGVPAAGGLAVVGAGAGAVTVPGFGTVPGYLVGLLAGLALGTSSCMAVHLRYKARLQRLLEP